MPSRAPQAQTSPTGSSLPNGRTIGDHGVVSQYFQVGRQVLWNPSTGVAELFVHVAQSLASTAGTPTGIGAVYADEYEIDPDNFAAFVNALVDRYLSSHHPIFRSLLEGFLATAIVLVDRAGRDVPALTAAPSPRPRDVSVGPAGIAASGDAAHLRLLAQEHARAMPY
jgi:hypothetical protein